MNKKTREKFILRITGEGIKSKSRPAIMLFKVNKDDKEIRIGHPMYFDEKDELYQRIIDNSPKLQKYLIKIRNR